jgi:RNA polymerase sigma-70 factor (ECF subfamily)
MRDGELGMDQANPAGGAGGDLPADGHFHPTARPHRPAPSTVAAPDAFAAPGAVRESDPRGDVAGRIGPDGGGLVSQDVLFERAVAEHSRRLLAIARAIVGTRASPEDVVQQAVLNLFTHRRRYDWHQPGPLLKRAVINEALRLLRPPKMSMVDDEVPDAAEAPVTGLIGNETVQRVQAAIDQLPAHFRSALVLCEYENMSYVEIAETLNATVPQVKTWLHRARRKLAELLSDYVNDRKTQR